MRMTSVVCNVPVLSQNDSTYHHSVFTTWKWHPFATWTPSFIILVWGHHPPLRRTVFACLQNCYNSCISCSRRALRYDSINSNLMNYSWTNGRLAIPAPAGLLVIRVAACMQFHSENCLNGCEMFGWFRFRKPNRKRISVFLLRKTWDVLKIGPCASIYVYKELRNNT